MKRFWGGHGPDIITQGPDGKLHYENVGKAQQSGEPIKRERDALDDLERATGERPAFTPYEP